MKPFFLLIAVLALPRAGHAQSVGIGTATPTASAALEVRSTTQGLLLPRLTTAQMDAIAGAVPGLLVYNTTLNKFCGYEATSATAVTIAQTASEALFAGQPMYGQSFTTTDNATFASITVHVGTYGSNIGTDPLTLTLYRGGGFVTPVGTLTQPVNFTASNQAVTFDLSNLNLTAVPNQGYTYALERGSSRVLGVYGANTSLYAGGQLYLNNNTPPNTAGLQFEVNLLRYGQWVPLN